MNQLTNLWKEEDKKSDQKLIYKIQIGAEESLNKERFFQKYLRLRQIISMVMPWRNLS